MSPASDPAGAGGERPARDFGREGLRLEGIRLERGSFRLDVGELRVFPGLTALLGPNGSGKSTLLRIAAGLLAPDAGAVLLGGRPVRSMSPRERARLVSYLPQTPPPATTFSVRESVAAGRTARLGPLGRLGASDRFAVEEAIRRVGLEPLADRPLGALSGGELQRAALARVLAQETPCLLLDEPTSAQDPARSGRIAALARSLADEGRIVLAPLHDLNLALRRADRLLFLREGRILADRVPGGIDPELLERVYETPFEILAGSRGPAALPL